MFGFRKLGNPATVRERLKNCQQRDYSRLPDLSKLMVGVAVAAVSQEHESNDKHEREKPPDRPVPRSDQREPLEQMDHRAARS